MRESSARWVREILRVSFGRVRTIFVLFGSVGVLTGIACGAPNLGPPTLPDSLDFEVRRAQEVADSTGLSMPQVKFLCTFTEKLRDDIALRHFQVVHLDSLKRLLEQHTEADVINACWSRAMYVLAFHGRFVDAIFIKEWSEGHFRQFARVASGSHQASLSPPTVLTVFLQTLPSSDRAVVLGWLLSWTQPTYWLTLSGQSDDVRVVSEADILARYSVLAIARLPSLEVHAHIRDLATAAHHSEEMVRAIKYALEKNRQALTDSGMSIPRGEPRDVESPRDK